MATLADIMVRASRDRLQQSLQHAVSSARPKAEAIFAQAIRAEPECDSLLNGELRYHFGLANPESEVARVVQGMTATMQLLITPATGDLAGGLRVILASQTAMQQLSHEINYTSEKSGSLIEWLKWLLFLGDNVIVTGYEIRIDERLNFKGSRTDHAIMVKRNYDDSDVRGHNRGKGRHAPVKSLNSWGVPAEFAGTADNNWLVRAAQTVAPVVNALLVKETQRAFNG